jgi:inhibitor of KinA
VRPLGDRAVIIHVGDRIDEATHQLVRAVVARLEGRPVAGTIELVPAFASVAVHYDPHDVPHRQTGAQTEAAHLRFASAITTALADLEVEALPAPRNVEIPVCYGGEHGPDLDSLAERHGVAVEEIVRLHTGAAYRVYMLGFAPGFAYLGGLPEAIATPRRPEPRTAVPAGSVGIGGSQTGIYPLVLPGGWQLIGRTPLRMFDATRASPTLLSAGDAVTFRAIEPDEFTALAATA